MATISQKLLLKLEFFKLVLLIQSPFLVFNSWLDDGLISGGLLNDGCARADLIKLQVWSGGGFGVRICEGWRGKCHIAESENNYGR